MNFALNGVRVLGGSVLLTLAAIFGYFAATFEQSYDASEGQDVMMTSFLGAMAFTVAAGGLAFLPLRSETITRILAGTGFLGLVTMFAAAILFT